MIYVVVSEFYIVNVYVSYSYIEYEVVNFWWFFFIFYYYVF